MLNDRSLDVGVEGATMEILGEMVDQDPAIRERNLQRAYELGKMF
jgi:hypothetical protein